MFTPDPIPRPAGPPASSTPLHDYFGTARPGADANYVVLPRSLVEAMPLPWQQHMTYLLAEFHEAFAHVTWPIYRVQPSRHEKLADLDEEQLAEVGYLVEIEPDGEVVYRDRSGRVVGSPADTTVLVSCLDPIPPPRSTQQYPRPAPQPTWEPVQGPLPPPAMPPAMPPASPPASPPLQDAVPMDDSPETPPTGFRAQPMAQPGEFGPTGPPQRSRHARPW